METGATSNAQTITNYFKTIDATKSTEEAGRAWAPGHQMHFPSNAPGVDREGHKGMSQMFATGFPDFKHEIQDTIEAVNKVVLRGVFTGTHKGTFNGIPATGKNVRASWIDITEFDKDGKILNEWVELDSVGLMQQLGVIPSPPLVS